MENILQSLKVMSPRPTIIGYDLKIQLDFISNYVIQYNVICADSHVFTNKST